jgi:hypothetical protein
MTHTLRPGTTFCETSGRLLFLDLCRDRYFCLGAATEAAFRRLVAGEIGVDDPRLEGLLAEGLLVGASSAPGIAPIQDPPLPTRSLLDAAPAGKPPGRVVAAAAFHLLATHASLRWRGLAATIAALTDRKHRSGQRPCIEAAAEAAVALLRVDRLLSPLDQCLPRSIALARLLGSSNISATLVIGVKLRPFLAHSWVQSDGMLLNERHDFARNFTPILVV